MHPSTIGLKSGGSAAHFQKCGLGSGVLKISRRFCRPSEGSVAFGVGGRLFQYSLACLSEVPTILSTPTFPTPLHSLTHSLMGKPLSKTAVLMNRHYMTSQNAELLPGLRLRRLCTARFGLPRSKLMRANIKGYGTTATALQLLLVVVVVVIL